MPRGPLHFRQRDLTAAVKAVENAGKRVSKVGLDRDGNIAIYVAGSNIAADNAGKHRPSEWERISNEELEQARAKARLHQKLG